MSEKRTLGDVLIGFSYDYHDAEGESTLAKNVREISADIMACVPADVEIDGKTMQAQDRQIGRNATLAEVRANIKRYTEGK